MAISVFLAASPGARAQKEDLNALNLQVTALQTLYDLELTAPQLAELSNLAKGTGGPKPAAREVKASDELRKALTGLRDALLKGDDDQINDCRTKYDDLLDKDSPDFDEVVAVTDAARKQAPRFLALLTARQAATFLSTQDVAGPRERLIDGFEDIRGLSDDEKAAQRDEIAEQVGWLIAGLDAAKAKQVAAQAAKLLDQVASLKDADFKKQRPDLEKRARDLVGGVSNLMVLKNDLDYRLAELMSNPFFETAVRARLKKGAGP
jgi:hypothetical protein